MITPAPYGLFLAIIFAITVAFVILGARAFRTGPVRPALFAFAWLALTGAMPFAFAALGASAALQFPAFALTLILAVTLALTGTGTRIARANGLALLAAIQVFRLPLEYVLILWHEEGFMPVQMTWHGDNLDIVTGALALPAAFLISRNILPRLTAFAFNLLGLIMLLRIIWIVGLSSQTPLRDLLGGYETGPDVLVGLFFPSVWIATVGVAGALFLHVASLACLLRRERRAALSPQA